MGSGDGSVIGITKILDNGSVSDRCNLVLVAEGFQANELNQFAVLAQQFVTQFFAQEPYLTNAFNVYRLDVTSIDSGADDPTACGGTGATPSTYFDASFCSNSIPRLLTVDTSLLISVVNSLLPEWHLIVVIVNSTIWGGSGGGRIVVFSIHSRWIDGIMHELGHAAFGLADEYEYILGCGIDTNLDHYTGAEPPEPNVTINTNRNTIKWGNLIDPTTPLPTTINANCAFCDLQSSPVSPGIVGAFEGAYYCHCGAYRPEFNCMMRNLSNFCAVCMRQIRLTLAPFLRHIEVNEFILDEFRGNIRILQHFDRWILVAYLIVNMRIKELGKDMKLQLSKEFYETISKHLSAYLRKNTMPPKEIAEAILNLADDYIANRQMNLRAGDYIALQKYIKKSIE